MSVQHLGAKHFSPYLAHISVFAHSWCCLDFLATFYSFHLMPRPGIELTAELLLLEGPFKGALPTRPRLLAAKHTKKQRIDPKNLSF